MMVMVATAIFIINEVSFSTGQGRAFNPIGSLVH
jgi:hypothetical protein